MKVKTPEAGGVAESLYGRDEGRLYIIVGREGERLLLADGKYKSCFAPKKKNAKHVRLLPKFFSRDRRAYRRGERPGQRDPRGAESGGAGTDKKSERRKSFVSKDDVIETEGKVVEALPNATFKVQLSNGHVITAYISGKLRMNYIRIIPGDTVKLEMSPYDLTKGRITWRGKS